MSGKANGDDWEVAQGDWSTERALNGLNVSWTEYHALRRAAQTLTKAINSASCRARTAEHKSKVEGVWMSGARTGVEASRTVGVEAELTRLAGGCELVSKAKRRRRGRGGRSEMGARGIKQDWDGGISRVPSAALGDSSG